MKPSNFVDNCANRTLYNAFTDPVERKYLKINGNCYQIWTPGKSILIDHEGCHLFLVLRVLMRELPIIHFGQFGKFLL